MMNRSRYLVSGAIFGSLLTTSSWAMEMPEEVWGVVLSKLPPSTLGKVALVSQKWLALSEDDKLWQLHGFPSKKECMKFPYSTLDRAHLVALFEKKYLVGNGVFLWKLCEEILPPSEIINAITPPECWKNIPIEWGVKKIICRKQGDNLREYTLELVFYSEMMKIHQTYTILPYILTLVGCWGGE